jgi:hypothetical protein
MGKVANILVELDAILDSRLGTLYSIYPDKIDNILKNGYHTRIIDKFSLLDKSVDDKKIEEAYHNRNVDILANARITEFAAVLKGISLSMESEAITTPFIEGSKVTVNIYPYVFTVEWIEKLKDLVKNHLGVLTGVDVVSLPPESLTPSFIKHEFDMVVLYNFQKWLKENQKALLEVKTPAVVMLAPAIYEILPPKGTEIDPFLDVELSLAEFIKIVFVDVKYFSVITA